MYIIIIIPANLSRHLQSVLNAAARSVAGLPRSDHITNTLASFHTGCVFPSASSSNWRLWYRPTGHFTASRHSTSLMTCASLPISQADDYDQQALSSWRYPELGWFLLATELSVLLDRGYGTLCRAMSLSVRLSMLFVENSNISFLVCLSLDIDCFPFLSRGPWGFYLGHVKNLYTIQYNTTQWTKQTETLLLYSKSQMHAKIIGPWFGLSAIHFRYRWTTVFIVHLTQMYKVQ